MIAGSFVSCEDLPSTPRRLPASIMGASDPPVTVAPLEFTNQQCCCRRSRLGPVYGVGEGVSQNSFSGKYACNCFLSPPEMLPNSRVTSPLRSSLFLGQRNLTIPVLLPGRPNNCTEEAPNRSNPVVFPASDQHSRPGPVIGVREGVFRTQSSGEYPNVVTSPSPDIVPHFSTSHDNNVIRIYYQNVRGLKTKIDSWFLAVTSCDYDVIVLTETWLDDRIHPAQLFGTDFEVYRADRNALNSSKRSGGGVLIAVRKNHPSSRVTTQFCTVLEQVWVRIKLRSTALFICSLYLPPDRVNSLEFLEGHLESIRWIESTAAENDEVIVFGDYNMPGIRWILNEDGEVSADPAIQNNRPACCTLLDGMAFSNMQQLNLEQNSHGRILDLVFAMSSAHTVMGASEVLIDADAHHPPLEALLSIAVDATVPEEDLPQLNFRKIDFVALAQFLRNYDWSVITDCNDVDAAVTYLLAILNEWLINNVPRMQKRKKPPWSNSRLKSLRSKKNAALRFKRRSRSSRSKRAFHRASAAYVQYNAVRYRGYVRRMQSNLRRNPKSFWTYVNSKRKQSGLPVSMFLKDQACTSSDAKCSLFADHFTSAFCDEALCDDDVRAALAYVPSNVLQLDTFEITEEMIIRAARKLKTSYSAGPDGIPAVVYKKCTAELLKPLQIIFNYSMTQAKFPSSWKSSFMFPVFKKGDKRNIQNYRGITSLSAGNKLFELIVNDYLQFRCKSYISTDQHGFVPKRSVVTNLLNFTSSCIDNIERGYQVDAIYTDLKAAFDRVNHKILLAKLLKLGASDRFANWMLSYLTDRTLQVRIGKSTSDVFSNPSGVPQGSILGPSLYNLSSNDAVFVFGNGPRLLYADDLKIYRCIKQMEDCFLLQQLLTAFANWCAANRLTLSIDKCTVISYHRKTTPILFDYTIGAEALDRSDAVRDLGVLLDCNMNFNQHRSITIDKANRQLGFILKISKDFKDPYCLRSLYCSLVRSHLEFASIIWTPHQSVWTERIERVQKRFIRRALRDLPWNADEPLPPYAHRCQLLNLDTLENRRKAEQAAFVSKLLKHEVDSPLLLSQLQMNVPLRPTRTFTLLRPNRHRTNYGLHEPFTAMIYQFNRFYRLFDFNTSTANFKFNILMNLRRPEHIPILNDDYI